MDELSFRYGCGVRDELTPFRHARSNPSTTIVTRAEGYMYAAKVWDVCLVQGPFSCRPRVKPYSSDSEISYFS